MSFELLRNQGNFAQLNGPDIVGRRNQRIPRENLRALRLQVQNPWEALRPISGNLPIWEAKVRPLVSTEVEQVKRAITDNNTQQRYLLSLLEEGNRQVFDEHEEIGVFLDGRTRLKPEGYLGDMIAVSGVVNTLLAAGKRVAIITPHDDVFGGTLDERVRLIHLDPAKEGNPIYPLFKPTLKKLSEEGPDMPIMFPINAAIPIWVQVDQQGRVANKDLIDEIGENIFSRKGYPHSRLTTGWMEQRMHQVQGLQVLSNILGINDQTPDYLPPPFLSPDTKSQDIAAKVINELQVNPEKHLVLLHHGVAAEQTKIHSKFYPEQAWEDVFYNLIEHNDKLQFLTFIPTDPKQAQGAHRIIAYAEEAEFEVVQVPLDQIMAKYGWSLGAYINFMQHLHQNYKPTFIGVDSMPAHLADALDIPSIVIGNEEYPPTFFSGVDNQIVVRPGESRYASTISPRDVSDTISLVLAL